jgi:hypothetical protein
MCVARKTLFLMLKRGMLPGSPSLKMRPCPYGVFMPEYGWPYSSMTPLLDF